MLLELLLIYLTITTALLSDPEKLRSDMKARYATRLAAKENIRITSYNVLSSHLSDKNHFLACNPDNLDPRKRLEKLKNKLSAEIEQNAIICLQEVSTTWAGSLHSLFSEANYHFVTALYGNKFNGYMGVGVAVPREKYTILDVDITRVADTKRMARSPKPTYFMSLLLQVKAFFLNILQMLGLYKPPFDMWGNVLYRTNQMICARLQHKDTDKKFVVGTYHMPCMFDKPSVMNTHCALSAQHIAKFAGEDPYIYTGDFNIKPDSSQYSLLTTGNLDNAHPDFPTLVDDWRPTVQPLRSAYKEHNGREPDFTNFAKVKNDPIFVDTLDYIFLSPEWSVRETEPLPNRSDIEGPLPNNEEPSDHILISATLALINKS